MTDRHGRTQVDAIGDELYALPPGEFTAARDAAAAAARAAGDTEAAKQLSALKRPTVGAHLVNLLALRRPELVDELIALGERIRGAQGTVPAAQVRELSRQRRSALADATAVCRTLALETGSGEPSATQLAEAESTLAAAMADASTADLVRSARLVKALTYAGFGSGLGSTAAPGSAPARPRGAGDGAPGRRKGEAARQQEEEAARERLRQAQQRLSRAEDELAAAQAEEAAANAELDRIADELSRLRRALDAASQRARAARSTRQAAQREVERARRDADPTG